MSQHDDFNFEPIPGLPEALPPGELLLWQGRPDEVRLGREAFRMRWIGFYFGVIALWQVVAAFSDFPTRTDALRHATGAVLTLAVMAFAVLALAAFFGRLMARQTVYSITSKRVVMRFGLAMPMAINIPFSRIDSAGLKLNADGTGDIPLDLGKGKRFAIFMLWPNARPGKIFRAEPMLRAVPNAQNVAHILSQALAATAGEKVVQPVRVIVASSPSMRPARSPSAATPSGPIATAS